MELTIRDYRPEDWQRLMEIHDAARLEELRLAGLEAAFLPLSVAAEREGLFDYAVAVACLEDVLAGFVAYSAEELAWLYVDPAFARRGIGRRLVTHALTHTVRPLYVEVLVGNEPARRLYLSCGFREERLESGRMPGNETFSVCAHILCLD